MGKKVTEIKVAAIKQALEQVDFFKGAQYRVDEQDNAQIMYFADLVDDVYIGYNFIFTETDNVMVLDVMTQPQPHKNKKRALYKALNDINRVEQGRGAYFYDEDKNLVMFMSCRRGQFEQFDPVAFLEDFCKVWESFVYGYRRELFKHLEPVEFTVNKD